MATLAPSQPTALSCPSCGSSALSFDYQQLIAHSASDRSEVQPANPLGTAGNWVAITLSCSECRQGSYIATGNSGTEQLIGIFPGSPTYPERSDNFAIGNGFGSVVAI